jgi:Holliday junction resolvase-like predicted endonuclease
MGETRAGEGARDRRTVRRRHGDRAEAEVAAYLRGRGWRILAAQLRVGRDEVDLLALEPGIPPTVVVVEVRGRSDDRFGVQEERVDAGKVRRLYRAAAALRAAGVLLDGTRLPSARWRVDLVAVDLEPVDVGWEDGEAARTTAQPGRPARIRHLQGLIPR